MKKSWEDDKTKFIDKTSQKAIERAHFRDHPEYHPNDCHCLRCISLRNVSGN